jgi:hypothetical protein
MVAFSPELIQIMRAALEEAMQRVSPDQIIAPGLKSYLAECILRAAAQGQTNSESLINTACDQVQTFFSMFT